MVNGLGDDTQYSIYSIEGKMIEEGLLKLHQPVDISDIPDGVYEVIFGVPGGDQFTVKMIKSTKRSF